MVQQRIIPIAWGNETTNEIVQSQNGFSAFETKEEFIAYLIRNREIERDAHHHGSDGFIYLNGVLKIDHRVKAGLNWNDVVATSAVVDSGMISKYQHLPKTYKGIKTSLRAPSLASYMQHNNYGAEFKNNKWYVEVLRIPQTAEHLDFSQVKADLTLFYGNQISLSKLPYSKNTLGLATYGLGIDCDNPYSVAKEKGCGKDILAVLRPKGILNGLWGYLGSLVGSGHR